jgi:hypothetical protein
LGSRYTLGLEGVDDFNGGGQPGGWGHFMLSIEDVL